MSNLLQMQETLMRDDARERGYYILSLLSLSLSLSLSFIYHTCLRISLSLLLHGVVEQHPGAFHGAFRALDD
jgi:hypothetical protein